MYSQSRGSSSNADLRGAKNERAHTIVARILNGKSSFLRWIFALNSALNSARVGELWMEPETQILSAQPMQLQHLQNAEGEGVCHYEREHTLYISLAAKPIHYLQSQDGKTHTGLYRSGDVSVVPANSPLFARWEGDENCLQIRLKSEWVRQIAQETLAQDCDRLQLQPEFQTQNPQLRSIGLMLLNEHQKGSLGSQLYTDSLANVLTVNLLRAYTTTCPQLPTYEGGLSPRQLRQILAYIDAHLDEDIKLASLAKLIGMSQYHFSRLFKHSLHISPYQYLLQQRVERAKGLLKQTDRLITEIALDCGFNSHSHLSKQFRQLTGMTPRAYRAQRR